MSRQNSALASITATYTDTDSEPEEDEEASEQDPVSSVEAAEEPVNSTPPDSVKQTETEQQQEPMEIEPAVTDEKPKAHAKKRDLVSYMSKEDQIDDDAIDDYDYYRDSREASDEEDESSKDNKDSPDVKPDSVIAEEGAAETQDEEQGASANVEGKRTSILPLPASAPVSAEAQRIVDKMFESKSKRHLDVNKYIQSNKSFRNPSIYEKLIEYCDLDELGTNYPKEVFDPHEWPASSYYDELAKAQKAEMDRREKARRERVKVEFVAGVVPKRPVQVLPPGASAAAAQAHATAVKLAAAAPLNKEPEKRKSKWDQRV